MKHIYATFITIIFFAVIFSGCSNLNSMKSENVQEDKTVSRGKHVEKDARIEVRNLTGYTINVNGKSYKQNESLFVVEPDDQDILEINGTSNKKQFRHIFNFREQTNFSGVLTPQYQYAIYDYFEPSEIEAREFVLEAFDPEIEGGVHVGVDGLKKLGPNQMGILLAVHSATESNGRWNIEYRGYLYKFSPEGKIEKQYIKYFDEGITEDIWKQLYPGRISMSSPMNSKNLVVLADTVNLKQVNKVVKDFYQQGTLYQNNTKDEFVVELKGYRVPKYVRVTASYQMHQLDKGLPVYVVIQNPDTDREIEVFYKNNLVVMLKHSQTLAFEMEDGDDKHQLTFNVYPVVRGVRKTSANNSTPILVSNMDYSVRNMTQNIQNTYVKGLYRYENGKIQFIENPGVISAVLIMQGVKTTNFFNQKDGAKNNIFK